MKTVAQISESKFEAERFLKLKFGKVIEKVQDQLGLKGEKGVDSGLVLLMMRTCSWGIQVFNYPENSQWCSLFDKEDIKAFD